MNLVWLRKDLRIQDHPALHQALSNGSETRVIFIKSIDQWKHHNESDAGIEFRLNRVQQLQLECKEIGIQLDILEVKWFKDIPSFLLNYCLKYQVNTLHFIKETPIDENLRDQHVIDLLTDNSIQINESAYDLIVSQPVFNLSGQPFKMFTPFYKKWLSMIDSSRRWERYKLIKKNSSSKSLKKPLKKPVDESAQLKLSSASIKRLLKEFCENKITDYQTNRDYPAMKATSELSAHLAYGMLGPRQCLAAIKNKHDLQNTDWKSDFWLRELAWRDFYRQLMLHFPRISKDKDFKTNTKNIIWRKDDKNLEAWKSGQTGFPIIDAAMRQLNQTGWMHNRLRMLAASFLTKLLFIDWREGEKYFMQNLIDGEFSANNGGWQWSASTGCDSAPYFRVFNPTAQSEKFDKNGDFIKIYVPELKNLNNKSIHIPNSEQRLACNYPEPIIDYKKSRIRAIELFKQNS